MIKNDYGSAHPVVDAKEGSGKHPKDLPSNNIEAEAMAEALIKANNGNSIDDLLLMKT